MNEKQIAEVMRLVDEYGAEESVAESSIEDLDRIFADNDKARSRIETYLRNLCHQGKFKRGDRVRKVSGSEWEGVVVGEYSTTFNPEGYAVESCAHKGTVQIYPAKALELLVGNHYEDVLEMVCAGDDNQPAEAGGCNG